MCVLVFFLTCLFATTNLISYTTGESDGSDMIKTTWWAFYLTLAARHAFAEVTSDCEDLGDCINDDTSCDSKCGCSGAAKVMFYNETLDECTINVKQLLVSLTEQYNTQDKIRNEVDKIFKGILVSVILFITCASFCFLTACVYCCRINYMDNKLKNDLDAFNKKLKRDGIIRKTIRVSNTKAPTKPAEESCNVVVESAGVYVV